MKRVKIGVTAAFIAFFSTIFGASSKVWGYSFGETFLTIGLIMIVVAIVILLPRDNSFLDKWNE